MGNCNSGQSLKGLRERKKSLICGGSNNRESDDTNGYNPLQKIAVYESDEIDVGMVKMQFSIINNFAF